MEGIAQALRILLALAMIEKLRMFSMGTALMAAHITSTSASGKRQAVPKPKPNALLKVRTSAAYPLPRGN